MVEVYDNLPDVVFTCPVIDSSYGSIQPCGSRISCWRRAGEEHRVWARDFIFEGKCDHAALPDTAPAHKRLVAEANLLLERERDQRGFGKVAEPENPTRKNPKAQEALELHEKTKPVSGLPVLWQRPGVCAR